MTPHELIRVAADHDRPGPGVVLEAGGDVGRLAHDRIASGLPGGPMSARTTIPVWIAIRTASSNPWRSSASAATSRSARAGRVRPSPPSGRRPHGGRVAVVGEHAVAEQPFATYRRSRAPPRRRRLVGAQRVAIDLGVVLAARRVEPTTSQNITVSWRHSPSSATADRQSSSSLRASSLAGSRASTDSASARAADQSCRVTASRASSSSSATRRSKRYRPR